MIVPSSKEYLFTTLCLGLFKSSGGPSKSVRAFQQALNSEVVSWVDPFQVRKEQLIWECQIQVTGSQLPVFRKLLLPAKGNHQAEQRVADSKLVSCHSYWRWHGPWLRKIAEKHNVPYWFVPHGSLDPYVFREQGTLKHLFHDHFGRRFIEEAACVVFSTEAEKKKALEICTPRRTAVIPWPLADEDFKMKRTPWARDQMRKRLGIPDHAFCFLYFGRLHPMKRPLETIQALATSGLDAHLIIMGNEFGVTEEDCRKVADRAGISDRVHVVGAVYGEKKSDYFSASDAYVSLSHRENFNFTAAECMAAGLPVLLSSGNDLGRELHEVGGCIWLEQDKPDCFEQALQAMSSLSVDKLKSVSEHGLSYAQHEFTFARFQSRIKDLAGDVISRAETL